MLSCVIRSRIGLAGRDGFRFQGPFLNCPTSYHMKAMGTEMVSGIILHSTESLKPTNVNYPGTGFTNRCREIGTASFPLFMLRWSPLPLVLKAAMLVTAGSFKRGGPSAAMTALHAQKTWLRTRQASLICTDLHRNGFKLCLPSAQSNISCGVTGLFPDSVFCYEHRCKPKGMHCIQWYGVTKGKWEVSKNCFYLSPHKPGGSWWVFSYIFWELFTLTKKNSCTSNSSHKCCLASERLIYNCICFIAFY